MLVHAYLTNGFLEMAEVFLRSLHWVHESAPPYVWLDTRGVKPFDIAKLKECYPTDKLNVVNRALPMEDWAKQAGVSVDTLKKYKRQCEGRFVSNTNKVWKLLVAADDRVKALERLIFQPDQISRDMPDWEFSPKFFAHFDIDTLFRKPLTGLPKMMEEADIWLKLRKNHPTVKARITIDVILVRAANEVRTFFARWLYHIDRIAPADRQIGWGQGSCWAAFVERERKLKYKQLPLSFGLPGRNNPDDIIWTGNVHKLAKDDCVKLFRKEFKKCKES